MRIVEKQKVDWEEVIGAYQTPYKYGKPVLAGSGVSGRFDEKGVDIPFVFEHLNRFYMLYTGYDGFGYQSALAVSDDLLHWEHLQVILGREEGSGRWDGVSAAATWIIKESDNLYDTPRLKNVDGKYWMAYHAYPMQGYEEGAARIGLAWCGDEDLLTWHRLEEPVLVPEDGEEWERGGLYKACIVQKDGIWHLFYNAKNTETRWIEQTGGAVSTDLLHWKRCENNPLLRVTPDAWDGRFVSDPYIVKDNNRWVNFYFGYEHGHAQEGLAVSDDLVCWDKMPQPLLPHGGEGEIDENHAHKASIFYLNGILYHFYCATRPARDGDRTEVFGELRTITAAASQPWRRPKG